MLTVHPHHLIIFNRAAEQTLRGVVVREREAHERDASALLASHQRDVNAMVANHKQQSRDDHDAHRAREQQLTDTGERATKAAQRRIGECAERYDELMAVSIAIAFVFSCVCVCVCVFTTALSPINLVITHVTNCRHTID
jgi:hypothetical protein